MDNQIICPHCKKLVAINEAMSHQFKEKYEREKEQEREKLIMLYKKRIEEEKQIMAKEYSRQEEEITKKMKQKLEKEMEMKFLDTKNEAEELQKEKQALQEQVLDTNKLLRQLKSELEQKNLEVEKKLAQEEERIKATALRQADEKYQLEMRAMEKKIEDARKSAEEYKRKLEQGSQQLQGEVLELQIEELLKKEFPYDDIQPVAKGSRGGDVVQIVKNNVGISCGTIIWELKRTKAWSPEWLSKLKDDQRKMKAEAAVIITQALPSTIKNFGCCEDIWVGDYHSVLGLALALRKIILEVQSVKNSIVGRNDKKEILFNYIYSTEFKHRVQAIAEAFMEMRDDLQKEKNWFMKKWNKQEKVIQQVMDNTYGMYGDVQGILGKSLDEMDGFDTLPQQVEPATVKAKVVNGDQKPTEDSLF